MEEICGEGGEGVFVGVVDGTGPCSVIANGDELVGKCGIERDVLRVLSALIRVKTTLETYRQFTPQKPCFASPLLNRLFPNRPLSLFGRFRA
jgi:hypothetical protein